MAIPRCGTHANYRDTIYSVFRGCTRPESHPGACRNGDRELTPQYLDTLYEAETTPSREEFLAYVEVQAKGDWNMYAPEAIQATGLTPATYGRVQKDYSALTLVYPDVVALVTNPSGSPSRMPNE